MGSWNSFPRNKCCWLVLVEAGSLFLRLGMILAHLTQSHDLHYCDTWFCPVFTHSRGFEWCVQKVCHLCSGWDTREQLLFSETVQTKNVPFTAAVHAFPYFWHSWISIRYPRFEMDTCIHCPQGLVLVMPEVTSVSDISTTLMCSGQVRLCSVSWVRRRSQSFSFGVDDHCEMRIHFIWQFMFLRQHELGAGRIFYGCIPIVCLVVSILAVGSNCHLSAVFSQRKWSPRMLSVTSVASQKIYNHCLHLFHNLQLRSLHCNVLVMLTSWYQCFSWVLTSHSCVDFTF